MSTFPSDVCHIRTPIDDVTSLRLCGEKGWVLGSHGGSEEESQPCPGEPRFQAEAWLLATPLSLGVGEPRGAPEALCGDTAHSMAPQHWSLVRKGAALGSPGWRAAHLHGSSCSQAQESPSMAHSLHGTATRGALPVPVYQLQALAFVYRLLINCSHPGPWVPPCE